MNVADREWQRFTPKERFARFIVYLCTGLLLAWSFQSVQIIPEFLADAPTQMADLFHRMVPVDFGFYYDGVHTVLIETLHIATLGTLLTLVMALPIGVMAAKNVCKVPFFNWLATLILVSSRSVNSLVWAMLFVAIFGPGTLAGVITISVRSIGFVGKLFGEALEEAHIGPVEAMKAAGAPWFSIFTKAYWPQVSPAFWSIALFRWDINVRESSVIGLVGAGGIGVALDSALNLFQWTRVSLILLCIFAVVILAEILVTQIRKHII
ncbi:MAG: phosphonate ABC transporter, permease protein PhnE [Pseudomonadota bacterium]